MVKIVLVKFKNEYDEIHPGIDMNEWDENKLNHYTLKENIEDFIEFIDIKNTNQLMEILNKLNNVDGTISIDEFHYDSDYIYQGLFLHHDYMENNINKLGTQFIREKMHVISDFVIVKRSIINNDFDYVDITFDDITSILQSQFLHQAVIITPNGEIIEKSYVYHPLEINFNQSHLDNTRIHQYKLLDLVLNFHIDIKTNRCQSNYNKFASNIYKKKIYGNVLISLCDQNDNDEKNIDLNKDVIKYIINTLSKKYEIDKSQYSRQIYLNNLTLNDSTQENESVNKNKFIHNNFPVIALYPNFYSILKQENEKYGTFTNELISTVNVSSDILNDVE